MSQEAAAGTATTAAATPAQPQTAPAAAPQSASDPAKGNGQPLKAPLIADPEAFLRRARERNGIGAKKVAALVSTPAAPPASEPAKEAVAPAADAAPPAKTEEKPAEAKEAPEDDLPARVAKLSREERELAKRRADFEKAQAQAKAEREEAAKAHADKLARAEAFEKATKLLESDDIAGLFRMLKGDVNTSAVALKFLEQLQQEDERPMSPSEVDRIVAEKLKAQEAARAKAEEEQRKAAEEKARAEALSKLEIARESYVNACAAAFDKAKHPFIAASGLPSAEIIAYAESQRDDHGRIVAPDPEELLSRFEEKLRKRAEAAGWAPKPKEEPRPAPSPSLNPSSLAADSGGRIPPLGKRPSLDERRAELRAKARSLVHQ